MPSASRTLFASSACSFHEFVVHLFLPSRFFFSSSLLTGRFILFVRNSGTACSESSSFRLTLLVQLNPCFLRISFLVISRLFLTSIIPCLLSGSWLCEYIMPCRLSLIWSSFEDLVEFSNIPYLLNML